MQIRTWETLHPPRLPSLCGQRPHLSSMWDAHCVTDSSLSSSLTPIGREQRPHSRCSSCHRTWITFTSPESLPLAGWPGRMSWTPASSAACWSETEPWARPVWSSATPPMDTRQNTDRLALTSSQVSDLKSYSVWVAFNWNMLIATSGNEVNYSETNWVIFLKGHVQVEGNPVKVQLVDTAGQVRQFFPLCGIM